MAARLSGHCADPSSWLPVVAGLRAVIEAGAEMVLLDPMDDDPAVLRRLAAVAEEAAD